MAYEKQTWTTGEVITQEKLNHMEDGIANAGGDVEYIKIGSTGSFSIPSGQWANNTSVSFTDYKNLSQLIGDKTIIGFFAVLSKQSPMSLVGLDFSGFPNEMHIPIYLWNTYEGTRRSTSALATFVLQQNVVGDVRVDNADVYLIVA